MRLPVSKKKLFRTNYILFLNSNDISLRESINSFYTERLKNCTYLERSSFHMFDLQEVYSSTPHPPSFFRIPVFVVHEQNVFDLNNLIILKCVYKCRYLRTSTKFLMNCGPSKNSKTSQGIMPNRKPQHFHVIH